MDQSLFHSEGDGENGPPKIVLRDYQVEAIEGLRNLQRQRKKWNILSLPTGAGKTILAGSIMKACIKKGNRAIFIADRNALVYQTLDAMWKFGIKPGLMQASNTYGLNKPVVIASSQTLEARKKWPEFHLAIIDESHTMRKKLIKRLKAKGVPVIGLTATPMAQGLGLHYDDLVTGTTTNQLIKEGWLVRLDVYIGKKTVKIKGNPKGMGGEYTSGQAEEGAQEIVCDIPTEWVANCRKHFGGPVKTLVFVPTVAYGAELANQFNLMGYKFRQVSYKHSTTENQESIESLKEGDVHGLISVEALCKGLDVTDVQYLACARKYSKSLVAQIQMLGRGMRSHPGKDFCLVLDHARNFVHHGSEIELFWENGCTELDRSERGESKPQKPPENERVCQKCNFVMPRSVECCPRCGNVNKPARSKEVVTTGKMVKWEPFAKKVPDPWPHVSQLAIEKHPDNPEKAKRYALAVHRDITGKFPAWGRKLEPNGRCSQIVREEAWKSYRRWRSKHSHSQWKEKENRVT